VPDQNSIFDNLAMRLFKVVMMCRIGRGVTYNGGVSPTGRRYYDSILSIAGDKFAPHVMASLSDFEIRAKLSRDLCRKHSKDSLILVKANVINARLIECLDYLIANIEGNSSCVNSAEFRKLSSGYINFS
jgi:hypothetical protein